VGDEEEGGKAKDATYQVVDDDEKGLAGDDSDHLFWTAVAGFSFELFWT
jgi:hypothetical protein